MVKTHEIELSTSVFNNFVQSDYIIIEDKAKEIEPNDYILFRQIETIEGETSNTGLYRLVQVKEVVAHQGLKDGYVLLVVNKL